jgi:nitrite reductase (NO-forming)
MQNLSTQLIVASAFILSTLALAPIAAAADGAAGQATFERTCAACHLPTGEGMPGVFPPLKKSDFFQKLTPAQLVKLVDNGLTGEVVVNGQKYNSVMPPQGLSDEDAANVLNHVSVTLNGGKGPFTVEQVKRLRSGK